MLETSANAELLHNDVVEEGARKADREAHFLHHISAQDTVPELEPELDIGIDTLKQKRRKAL